MNKLRELCVSWSMQSSCCLLNFIILFYILKYLKFVEIEYIRYMCPIWTTYFTFKMGYISVHSFVYVKKKKSDYSTLFIPYTFIVNKVFDNIFFDYWVVLTNCVFDFAYHMTHPGIMSYKIFMDKKLNVTAEKIFVSMKYDGNQIVLVAYIFK